MIRKGYETKFLLYATKNEFQWYLWDYTFKLISKLYMKIECIGFKRLRWIYEISLLQIQANIYFNIYKGFYLTIDISPRISTKLIFNGSCVSSIYADTNVTWSCLFSSVKSLFCQRDDTYLLHLGLVLCYLKITCMTCLYILNFTVTCVPSLERYINNNTQYSITAFLPNYKWSFIDII